jgi:hypothetical protein
MSYVSTPHALIDTTHLRAVQTIDSTTDGGTPAHVLVLIYADRDGSVLLPFPTPAARDEAMQALGQALTAAAGAPAPRRTGPAEA